MFNFITPSGKQGDPSTLHKAMAAGSLALRCDNIRRNIARGLPMVTPDAAERGSDVMKLVCFGPSLADNWEHIKVDEGDVWTVSGANRYLCRRGIQSQFHLEADPRPHKADLLRGACQTTVYLIASRCHPTMFEALSGKRVLLYHVYGEDERETLDDVAFGAFRVPPAWSMGNTALNIGMLLGYKKFVIYGMDGSFAEDGRQHPDDHPNEARIVTSYTVDGQRRFISSPDHLVAAECFIRLMREQPYGTFEFVGDGLIPYMYHRYTKDYRENHSSRD
jgi:hypothetical protein